MSDFSQQHCRWVANYISGKIQELHFHLTNIVTACDQSLCRFEQQMPTPEEIHQSVVYGFSALSNVILTLKDAIQTATGETFPWSRIKQLRHGSFMYEARNAATHDGNPVISGWADGRYFIPATISRIGEGGRLISISAPTADVRTLCLEFTEDYSRLLRQALLAANNQPALQGTPFNIDELDSAFSDSKFIPDFARQLFLNNRDEIAARLPAAKHDPAAQAVKYIDSLIQYCKTEQKMN